MKHLKIISLLLIGMMLPIFANILEFREITLKQVEGQDPLTEEQIQNAIVHHDLGKEKAVRVEIKDGKFSHSDVKPVKFVVEYNADFTVAKFEEKDVGIVILGTAQKINNQLRIAFSYSRTAKLEDLIYGVKDDHAILAPVFNSFNSSSEVVLDTEKDQWIVVRIPSKEDVRSYLAVKIVNPE